MRLLIVFATSLAIIAIFVTTATFFTTREFYTELQKIEDKLASLEKQTTEKLASPQSQPQNNTNKTIEELRDKIIALESEVIRLKEKSIVTPTKTTHPDSPTPIQDTPTTNEIKKSIEDLYAKIIALELEVNSLKAKVTTTPPTATQAESPRPGQDTSLINEMRKEFVRQQTKHTIDFLRVEIGVEPQYLEQIKPIVEGFWDEVSKKIEPDKPYLQNPAEVRRLQREFIEKLSPYLTEAQREKLREEWESTEED